MAKGDQIKGFLGNFIKQFFKNEPSEYNKEILEKVTNTKYIKPLKELNKEQESGPLNKVFAFLTGYVSQLKTNPYAVSGRLNGELNEEITTLSSKLKDIKADIINIKSNEDKIKSLTQQIADLEKKANDVPAQTNNNVKKNHRINNLRDKLKNNLRNGGINNGRNNERNNLRNKLENNRKHNKQPNSINDIDKLKNKMEKNNKAIEEKINRNNEFKQEINELLKGKLFKKGSQISNEATSEDIQKIIDEAENFIDLFKPENQQGKVKAQFEWIIQSDYEQSKTSERAQVQAGRISKTVAKVVVTQSIPQIMNGTQSFLSGKDEEQEYPQFGVMGQPMSYRDKLIRMVGNATQGV